MNKLSNQQAYWLGKFVLGLCGVTKARNEGVTALGYEVVKAVHSLEKQS